ncbi:MAG: GTPase Era [Actinomycetota bacterium]|nr:GTPase Era [Actinomycetota bacterium]
MKSGFAAVVGRPNVGKSTLVNRLVGTKVSIVSSRPNTTRHTVRGVVHRPGAQVVLVDTPGLHRPRTVLGERLLEAAGASLGDVDVVVAALDATAPIGRGDRLVLTRAIDASGGRREALADHLHEDAPRASRAGALLVALNKVDRVRPAQLLEQLASVAACVEELGGGESVEYFPLSALTGEGVDELVDALVERLPEGPMYYPEEMVTDMPEALQVAELVREQLLRRAREELPHSIACQVTEWEWPRIRCEIVVERDSQKGIVIGRGGEVLKDVGTAVRRQLPPGAYLELHVRVEKHWQQRPDALDRLGL